MESRRLLIVEDNPINQKVAARALARLGFCVDITSDGAQAVEAVRNGNYALILMDCMMPKMDGYQATRAIREMEEGVDRRTPIVAVTADSTAECRERCKEAGMDDFLSKPLDMNGLQDTLKRWVEESQAA